MYIKTTNLRTYSVMMNSTIHEIFLFRYVICMCIHYILSRYSMYLTNKPYYNNTCLYPELKTARLEFLCPI